MDSHGMQPSQLRQTINRLLEVSGRYQLAVIIGLNFLSLIVGISHTQTSFHTYTPKFFCRDYPDTSSCEHLNGTCPSGYQFDDDDHTVVTEWSLVCDRRFLAPLVNTLYFCGVTVGALACGFLADVWGRRKMILICLYAQGICGVALKFSSSLEVFIGIRILQGFFVQGLQGCTYTLMLEYCPPRWRTHVGVIWEIFWAFGLCVLGGTSFAVRDWRQLQLLLAIPVLLTIFYMWLIPESLCWYLATNKFKEAHQLCQRIERYNGNPIDDNISLSEDCKAQPLYETAPDEEPRSSAGIKQMFRVKCLRKHTVVMFSVWLTVTLSYYCILYFMPSLIGQRHLNFVTGAFIEIVAYVIAFFILSKYGRRYPMAAYQYINSGICFAIVGILLLTSDNNEANWTITVLALLAKGFAVSSFCGMFIYTAELFPTICRGVAFGACGFCGRIGSLTAPLLMLLGEIHSPAIPLGIIAILLLVTGSATILLPETRHSALPNTVKDATELWEGRS